MFKTLNRFNPWHVKAKAKKAAVAVVKARSADLLSDNYSARFHNFALYAKTV
jgi:hypothetical protein